MFGNKVEHALTSVKVDVVDSAHIENTNRKLKEMAINALDVVAEVLGNGLPPVAPRVRTYVDNQMNRRLQRVGMPYGYVAPRLEAPRCSRRLLGLEPEPVRVAVASPELPRNDQPEHFDAVVPRARLFSVMVPEAAIQIADDEDDMVEEELSVLESTLEEEEVIELSVLCGIDTTVEDPADWFLEETVSFLPTEEETVVFEEVVDEDATTNHAEETVWYGPEEVEVPATPVTPYIVIGNDVGVPLDWEVIPAPVVDVAPVPEAAWRFAGWRQVARVLGCLVTSYQTVSAV
ncbi:uncharacterized protein LOC134683580 [Mytilus trossulus]|uniref:uncharacterized protein LOC134683580 n=1 Tax=Mytilus trossulus TaxID=6551 RepID=UPI003006C058